LKRRPRTNLLALPLTGLESKVRGHGGAARSRRFGAWSRIMRTQPARTLSRRWPLPLSQRQAVGRCAGGSRPMARSLTQGRGARGDAACVLYVRARGSDVTDPRTPPHAGPAIALLPACTAPAGLKHSPSRFFLGFARSAHMMQIMAQGGGAQGAEQAYVGSVQMDGSGGVPGGAADMHGSVALQGMALQQQLSALQHMHPQMMAAGAEHGAEGQLHALQHAAAVAAAAAASNGGVNGGCGASGGMDANGLAAAQNAMMMAAQGGVSAGMMGVMGSMPGMAQGMQGMQNVQGIDVAALLQSGMVTIDPAKRSLLIDGFGAPGLVVPHLGIPPQLLSSVYAQAQMAQQHGGAMAQMGAMAPQPAVAGAAIGGAGVAQSLAVPGAPRASVPLPAEAAGAIVDQDTPVYVNAKQYNRILKRRVARAKQEAENKAVRARKAYLHESRHKHALRRARGSGGRFLTAAAIAAAEAKAAELAETAGAPAADGDAMPAGPASLDDSEARTATPSDDAERPAETVTVGDAAPEGEGAPSPPAEGDVDAPAEGDGEGREAEPRAEVARADAGAEAAPPPKTLGGAVGAVAATCDRSLQPQAVA